MDQSFVGTIYMFGGNFAPVNFALCAGQLMPISENEVLYTLLGTTYGGDGQTTFGIPDLRGRVAIGQGQGPGLSNYFMGQRSGSENVTLLSANMAQHNHTISVNTANATLQVPAANCWLAPPVEGSNPANLYSDVAATATLNPQTIGTAGGNQPLNIMKPINTITYVITLFGIFPSQS